LKVKIKKVHKEAIIPKYSKLGDACLDLVAVSKTPDSFGNVVFDTGLALEIPSGYVGLVFPRSSICKTMHQLRNCVGVIDSGYRGTIKLVFWGNISDEASYNVGDRIGQIMIFPYPQIEFEEVEELNSTERGIGGFGSTGV
jgi:dUTP pyrophosphatase